jgi:uncharacterized membrane protein (DUF485 family)
MKLHAFKDAFRHARSIQLLVSCLLSTILVLLAYLFLPDLPAAILLFPAFLLTVRLFPAGVHGGTDLGVAMILVSILLYAIIFYFGLRFVIRHWTPQ